jgi:hypothetical protein
MWKKLAVIFMLLMGSNAAKAQFGFGCIDSFMIQIGRPCFPDFEPLCGCDNVTYRNLCFLQAAGVNFFTDGPCEGAAFDFNPNPSIDFVNLRAITNQAVTYRIFITDLYGKFYYDRFFNNQTLLDLQIDTNPFPQGVYYVFLYTGFYFEGKKLIKVSP